MRGRSSIEEVLVCRLLNVFILFFVTIIPINAVNEGGDEREIDEDPGSESNDHSIDSADTVLIESNQIPINKVHVSF